MKLFIAVGAGLGVFAVFKYLGANVDVSALAGIVVYLHGISGD